LFKIPLDLDVASNGHNAALEQEEPVMNVLRDLQVFIAS